MRWLWILFLTSTVWAVTPIYNDYPDKNVIYQEFRNYSDNLQDKAFTKVTVSTPPYQSVSEGNIIIYISTMNTATTDIRLMLRVGTTLYVSPSFAVIKGN